jgi:hypothetical protein
MLEERFPDDLQWEALVDVLRGKVKINTHCYEVGLSVLLFRLLGEGLKLTLSRPSSLPYSFLPIVFLNLSSYTTGDRPRVLRPPHERVQIPHRRLPPRPRSLPRP